MSIFFTKILDLLRTIRNIGLMKIESYSRKIQGISFEIPVLKAAKERAKVRRQSLSAYINSLIALDVANNTQLFNRNKEKTPDAPQN